MGVFRNLPSTPILFRGRTRLWIQSSQPNMCFTEAKRALLKDKCFSTSQDPGTREVGAKTGRLGTEQPESSADHGPLSATDELVPSHFDWLSSGHMSLGNPREEK